MGLRDESQTESRVIREKFRCCSLCQELRRIIFWCTIGISSCLHRWMSSNLFQLIVLRGGEACCQTQYYSRIVSNLSFPINNLKMENSKNLLTFQNSNLLIHLFLFNYMWGEFTGSSLRPRPARTQGFLRRMRRRARRCAGEAGRRCR